MPPAGSAAATARAGHDAAANRRFVRDLYAERDPAGAALTEAAVLVVEAAIPCEHQAEAG